jgi:hypothetical protein
MLGWRQLQQEFLEKWAQTHSRPWQLVEFALAVALAAGILALFIWRVVDQV